MMLVNNIIQQESGSDGKHKPDGNCKSWIRAEKRVHPTIKRHIYLCRRQNRVQKAGQPQQNSQQWNEQKGNGLVRTGGIDEHRGKNSQLSIAGYRLPVKVSEFLNINRPVTDN